jgi:hypothetical protein
MRSGLSAARSEHARPTAALVGIYRRRNAHHVREIVEVAREAGWNIAWWALDDVDDRLADDTVGVGSGTKLPLLNEVVSRAGIETGWLVVADDDVIFTHGDVVELVELCEQADLDLAQPARSDDNSRYEYNVAHAITLAQRWSRARTTTFVEVGPLFVVGPRWWDRIVPFPAGRDMGWGASLDWAELCEQGCRLGIIDAIRVAHNGQVGLEYDFDVQVTRIHEELTDRGLAGWKDVQRTLEVWRPWQSVPPWLRSAASRGA